jgi:threonine/homoserine/homoserine lactone efflux protein
MDIFFVCFMGFLVSFLGQLPLGNMSITATQIGVSENISNAWKYSIGVVLVEMLYLRFALTGMDFVVRHRVWFVTIGWLTVVLFLVLGFFTIRAAYKQQPEKKALLLNNKMSRFALGLTMSALNPAQIPFWFLWTSELIRDGVIKINNTSYNLFTAGAGTGTIAGLAVYIYGGKFLITKMKSGTKTLNLIMGAIFIITALIQLYRMLYKPMV